MEVMVHYLSHFSMNFSILLYPMGLLKLKVVEDLSREPGHRGKVIL